MCIRVENMRERKWVSDLKFFEIFRFKIVMERFGVI